MKLRANFVSNSSSSSYVVVPENYHSNINDDYARLKVAFEFSENYEDWDGFLDGETCFGWQEQEYHDFESKWNWLVLQAFYGGQKYIEIINDFLSSISNRIELNWSSVEDAENNANAYIDHQSIDAQRTFDEIEPIGISNFLLDSQCYIQNGNDNG